MGAALGQVSGSVDKLVSITEEITREMHVEAAKKDAIEMAVRNGAMRKTCKIVDVSEMQMGYVAIPCVRLRVKAVGDVNDYTSHKKDETKEVITSSNKALPNVQKVSDEKKTDKEGLLIILRPSFHLSANRGVKLNTLALSP